MKKKIIITIVTIIMIIGGVIINMRSKNDITIINDDDKKSEVKSSIYVQISGEVLKPGVYEMNSDARVHDLIIIAGGFTSHADCESINLVQKLEDGMKITVLPKKATSSKISINKASIEELKQLDGIGDVKAQKIIDFRNTHGYFTKIEDLVIFQLLNEKEFEKIKDDICL